MDKGIILNPIDLFESSSIDSIHPHESHRRHRSRRTDNSGKEESVNVDLNLGGAGSMGRDIGVGIWSTGLKPFMSDNGCGKIRNSHLDLIQNLQRVGRWVGKVGVSSKLKLLFFILMPFVLFSNMNIVLLVGNHKDLFPSE